MTLRQARIGAGLNQGQLASILDVSRSTINRIEQGRQKPNPRLRAVIEVWMETQSRKGELCVRLS